ncbi:MAG: DNA repair protein RecO [Chloroflexi bacterium]|nr:DNA repair protein RecO [Chloroflexota bacterium]
MTPPRSYRAEAIVLRRTELGEADRVVTFFTAEYGKLKAVAKGVRKPKSKLAGLVELFTHSTLQIARGRGLDVLSQGEVIHPFLPLKTDLARSSCAFYVAELVSRFTVEHQENVDLFDILLGTMVELCETRKSDLLLRRFEMQLLQCMGYRPNLYHCTACNAQLKPTTNAFSPSGGGVLCPACAGADPAARGISVNSIKVLRLLQDGDWATALRVNIEEHLAGELEHVLRVYVEYLLERRVQSATWMDKVRSEVRKAVPPDLPQPSQGKGRADTAAAH